MLFWAMTFITILGWLSLLAALAAAFIVIITFLFRPVGPWLFELSKKLLWGITFAIMFVWQLLRHPSDLLHVLWLIISAPFAIAIGLVMGLFEFFRHPVDYITGKRQAHFQAPQPPQATKELPRPKK